MAELIREIVIDATPETIWPFLVEAEKHVQWLGTAAEIDPRPAASTGCSSAASTSPAASTSRSCRWRRSSSPSAGTEPDHPIPPGSTTVEISLHPEGEKTRVRLVHRGLPADAVDDHGRGWERYVGRLAVAATGGDPGPDDEQ